MSKIVEVTIKARMQVPDAIAVKHLSVDRNMDIPLDWTEVHNFSLLKTEIRPRILTFSHEIKLERVA